MEYYSNGNRDKVNLPKNEYKSFKAIKDNSSNILERNFLSVDNRLIDNRSGRRFDSYNTPKPEYKKYKILDQINKKQNYYLDVRDQFSNQEKYNISPLLCNSGEYSLQKKKAYAFAEERIKAMDVDNGRNAISLEEFNKLKKNKMGLNANSDSHYHNYCQNQSLFFDRNNKLSRKCKANYRSFVNEKDIVNKANHVSQDSPEWFKISTEKQLKDIENSYVNNSESLHVLSKFQKWITVTPRSKNRKRPLENVKLTSLESSKIIPYWMQIKPELRDENYFKSVQLQHIRDGAKQTVLVDKDQKNAKKFVLNNFYD